MDFIVSIVAFHGNTVIMVIIDCFSKAGHFRMLATHFSAYKATELFTTSYVSCMDTRRALYLVEILYYKASFEKEQSKK